MTDTEWQHSKPLPQPTRHRMRARTDFEDSAISARREAQAQEKRRLEAMAQALRARVVESDPGGARFRAEQQKAIAARRLDNARLEAEARKAEAASQGDQRGEQNSRFISTPSPAKHNSAAFPMLIAVLVLTGGFAAATVAFPELLRYLPGG